MLRPTSHNIDVQNVFGACSARHCTGFLAKPSYDAIRNRRKELSPDTAQPTATLNLHIGPCAVQWVSSPNAAINTNDFDGASKKGLERKAVVRLHSDSITQLLPLTGLYSAPQTCTTDSLIVSASCGSEIGIWTSEFEKLLSWNVYDSEETSMDLPINWMAYSPSTQSLAVVSGPKNPNLPPPPADDKISPPQQKSHRISLYDLSHVVSRDSSDSSTILEPKLIEQCSVIPNGEMFVAFSRFSNTGDDALAAVVVDALREHWVTVFPKESLSLANAARLRCPGEAIVQFTSSPDGSLLALVKGSSLLLYRANWNETTKKPEIIDLGSTKLSESAISPITWIGPQCESDETNPGNSASNTLYFMTYDSRGTLLQFELRNSENSAQVLLQRSISNQSALSKFSLPFSIIWDDFKSETTGSAQLIRICASGVEIDEFTTSFDGNARTYVPTTHLSMVTSDIVYSLTCCGTGFDDTGNFLAIGDWSGKLAVWRVSGNNQKPKYLPAASIPLKHSMIRSLEWSRHPHSDKNISATIMVGDTSGNLFECKVSWDENLESIKATHKRIANTKRTITCMQWSPKDSSKLLSALGLSDSYRCILATGDSDGKLRLYGRSLSDDKIVKLAQIQAHEQMPHVTSRDIWTVSFSPCGQYISTGSEDYSVHVYRMTVDDNNEIVLNLVQTLVGPDAAVTCVDWQNTPLGTLLLLVSDDRTLHVWKQGQGEQLLELFTVLRTNWENLMITYACLETNGTRIVCATMAGYVYMFDLSREGWRKRCKLHLGSIEGLAWNRNQLKFAQIAACSSDCTASVFQLSL